MKYSGPEVAMQVGNSALTQGEGPQLVTRLSDQARGLIELRTILRNTNKKLRGIQPSDGNKSAETPKPVELSLLDVARDIELLLEQCHSEASEASALLS